MLTTTEAAKRLGLTSRHVRELIERRELPARLLNSRTYVLEERHVAALARKRDRQTYSGMGRPVKKPPAQVLE